MSDAPQTLTIRTRSTGVKIRAGLMLGTAREWAEHEIACTVDGFKKLLALALEPGVQVHGKDEDGNWLPLPAAETIKAGIANLEAARDADGAQAAINTILPTAEPTLEREPDTTAAKDAAQEPTPQPEAESEEHRDPSPPAADDPGTPAPDAQAEDEVKAEPEA